MNTNPTILWLGIGWTMLHFLWVGGVIAAGSAVVLRQLRAATAEVRYAVALASLVLLALAPPAIAWRLACPSGSAWSGQPAHGLDQATPAAVSPVREGGGVIVIGEIQRQDDRASAVASRRAAGRSRPPRGVVDHPGWRRGWMPWRRVSPGSGWSARRSRSPGWRWGLPAPNGCGAGVCLSRRKAIYPSFAGAWPLRSGSAEMWPWPSATGSPRPFWWGSCGP